MKIKNLENTDHITKEDFNNMINIKEKTNIFIEILKNFDRSIARNKNTTFKIFDESRIAVWNRYHIGPAPIGHFYNKKSMTKLFVVI